MNNIAGNLMVRKRDQTLEEFNIDHITKVMQAAGLSTDKITSLNQAINNWAGSLNKNEITSLEIRDRVIEELKNIDTDTANLYQWYESTKK